MVSSGTKFNQITLAARRIVRRVEGLVNSVCLVRRIAVVAAAIVAVLGVCARAEAVPAFARKYQTSCQTCHIVFPKLNAFGEAFRLRGYRMPGETEEMIKQPGVAMGAPAYKRLWPEAVWPGDIPSYVPLAVNVKMADANSSTVN